MINGYLHVAAMGTPACLMVLAELHGRLLESGLYGKSDRISVAILGDSEQAELMYNMIFKNFSKYEVRYFSANLMEWEWATINLIKQDAAINLGGDRGYIWYAHTKGVSYYNSAIPEYVQRNSSIWRNVMSHYVFTKHDMAMDLLDSGKAAVGPLFISGPERYEEGSDIPRHFSGNFWWSTYKYLSTLPAPEKDSRLGAEFWIGKGEGDLGEMVVCHETTDYYGWGTEGKPGPLEHLPWCN
jgi:hypothetical protein